MLTLKPFVVVVAGQIRPEINLGAQAFGPGFYVRLIIEGEKREK